MIYICYFILLFTLLTLERRQKSKKNIFRLLIPLIYTLFIGCRGANVGVDTPVYYDHYFTYGQWGCDFVEIGFDWLNRFCYHLGWNQAPFFCICAAISIFPVAYVVGKYESRRFYSTFMLLFCTMTFVSMCNGMRQNMACGILFYLLMFVHNSKTKYIYKVCVYIIGIFVASLFHTSVLLVSPIILLYKLSMPNKLYIILYTISFIFVFVNISQYIPDIKFANVDYGRYIGGELANKAASSLGFLITTFRNILVLSIMLKINAFHRNPLFSNMAFAMILLTNIGFNIPILGRINMYFTFPFLYIMSYAFAQIRNTITRNYVLMRIALIGVLIVMTIYGYISPTNKVNQYTFCYDNSSYYNHLPN